MKIPTGPGRKSAAISTSRWSHFAASTSCARPTSKVRKATLFLFSVVVLLVGGAAAVRGQSALDGIDPNANDQIKVVVVQPDGKILLGGAFTTLSPNGGAPVTRNYIARLNPDGTLDTAFNPNANTWVRSIALQADGKILVGGDFNGANSIGGQARNYIARLDATTGAADSFNPNANVQVQSIAVQADGKILAGGDFTSIGGQLRNRIARLDATTGLADSFNPNANIFVQSIAVQADGKILAGGGFTSIGGQTRNRIARLDATTGLADSFNPNASDVVWAIAVQADGKILAGGFFNNIGGQARNFIARLDATTGLADSFNPNANAEVLAIAVQADGKILAGGSFFTIGGQTRNRIARLNPDGTLDTGFDPNASSFVYSIAVQADGKILAGGEFTTLSPSGGTPVTRNNIARLETDGRLDRTLDLGAVGVQVIATAVQPDGKVLLGGNFTTVLGVPRNRLARLNTDGTLDVAFNPNANNDVYAIAVQADGKILVGGQFNGANSIGGQTRNRVARLDATTGLADSFDPNANSFVYAIAMQADGKILVGGAFTGANSIGGQTRSGIARLDPNTGLADSFNPNANGAVNAITIQADGQILVGGGFTGANSIGGQTRNRIARLDPTTGLADSFDPNANNGVFSITVQADGQILAGGQFNGANSIGGQTRNRIARLDPTTGLADSFNPNASGAVLSIAVQADGKILAGGLFTGANSIGGQTRNNLARLDGATGLADSFNPNPSGPSGGTINTVTLQADGKVLAGGGFAAIGGQTRNIFARLSNDTAALQNLAVTQTTITWTRGGSSPQFTRVTFESSTDNVNYTSLGNGTAAGSNWTLTGLSLPTGQNIYIRARGYYRSGYQDGSESVTESVRNVALTAAPMITSANNTTFTVGTNGSFTVTMTGIPAPTVSESGALPSGVTFDTSTHVLSGTPAAGTEGTYPITFTASNGVGSNAVQSFTLTVGQAPAITSANNVTFTVGSNGSFTVTRSGFPAPTVSESGALPSGVTFNTATRVLSGTPAAGTGGTYPITFTASNGVGSNAMQSFTLTVNQAPAITGNTGTIFAVGSNRSFTVTTSGFPAPAVSESGALPSGVTFNAATRVLSGTPAAGTGRIYPITFTASNGVGSNAVQNFTLTVNQAPAITSANNATFTLGSSGSFTVTTSGFPAPTVFQSGALPSGVTFNSGARVLSGIPAAGTAGTYPITFTASNDGPSDAVQSFTLTVITSLGPSILSPLNVTGTQGLLSTYQFETAGATSLAVNNLPPGLAFDPGLQAIVGIPTTPGTFQIGLSASNSNGTTNATLTLTVQPPPASGPVIASSTAATGRVGQPFRFQVFTTGGTPAARVSASNLPAGLSIDPVSGLISGTPTAAESKKVDLFVTDGVFSPSSTLQLTFTTDPALAVIVGSNLVLLTPGQFFTYTITAPSGAGPSDATIFTLIGTLPVGLTFDATTGTISGTYTGVLQKNAPRSPLSPDLAGGALLGSVQLFATNAHGTSTFELLFLASPDGAVNISTRLLIGTGEKVLIGGFIVTGNAPKVVLIRAIGPSIGIPSALQDPTLELHDDFGNVVFNDNWQTTQEQFIKDTTIPPSDDRESAIVIALEPNRNYTAIVAGKDGATGIALAEVYDLGTASIDTSGNSKLANISTRGFVQTGDNVMIGGFIVQRTNTKIIARAIGPSLTLFGVAGALQDTTLELRDGSGALIDSNDNWRTDEDQAFIGTLQLAPTDDRESALVTTLTPGNYTAIVRGKNDTTGVALVEVYALQ